MIRYASPPSCSALVERNVMWGNFSASKKSPLTRWPSRSAMPVSMLAIFTSMEAEEFAGSVPSTTRVPSCSPKEPRTFVTIAWRTVKPMLLCEGSMVYVPVRAASAGSTAGASVTVGAAVDLRVNRAMAPPRGCATGDGSSGAEGVV